jgi:hypothetical protein
MGLIRLATIFAILGTVFLGIAAADAQVNALLPQFKSGASVMMGVPVDFNILNQRVGAIYEVVESNDSHIVWKFTGTTGDWAFVFADGRIIVTSMVNLDLATKDTLTTELNGVMDLMNTVNSGIITNEARDNAFNSATFYATEPDFYHRIKYNFDANFDLTLKVPNSTIKEARLTITGPDCRYCGGSNIGQTYYIDGKEIASCTTEGCAGLCGFEYRTVCNVDPVEIKNLIPNGEHEIKANNIDSQHTMIIEALTSPHATKKFVLYGPDYQPWINETGRSMTLDDLNSSITGVLTQPAITAIGTINTTNTSNFA